MDCGLLWCSIVVLFADCVCLGSFRWAFSWFWGFWICLLVSYCLGCDVCCCVVLIVGLIACGFTAV